MSFKDFGVPFLERYFCEAYKAKFISAYPDENNHSIDAVRYGMEKYANRKGN